MAAEEPSQEDARPEGVLHSLRTLLATLIAFGRTRLALLATELEDEKLRVLQLVVWGCAAAFFLALGVVMLTVFVLIVFWDVNRALTAFLLAAGYIAIGIALGVHVRNRAREKSRLFAASLAELSKDHDQLSSR